MISNYKNKLFFLSLVMIFVVITIVFTVNAEEKLGHPKMEQVLYFLSQSEDPKLFAKDNGIDLVDDRVRVIIELSNATIITSIPSRFDITVEEKDGNLVQALVSINDLTGIANESYVNYISTPGFAAPFEKNKSKQLNFPEVFFVILLLVFILLLVILLIRSRSRR